MWERIGRERKGKRKQGKKTKEGSKDCKAGRGYLLHRKDKSQGRKEDCHKRRKMKKEKETGCYEEPKQRKEVRVVRTSTRKKRG